MKLPFESRAGEVQLPTIASSIELAFCWRSEWILCTPKCNLCIHHPVSSIILYYYVVCCVSLLSYFETQNEETFLIIILYIDY